MGTTILMCLNGSVMIAEIVFFFSGQNNPFTVVAGNGRKLFVAQLFLILRECLLTHRPTEIANCLEALLNAPNSCRHTFHSVSCIKANILIIN